VGFPLGGYKRHGSTVGAGMGKSCGITLGMLLCFISVVYFKQQKFHTFLSRWLSDHKAKDTQSAEDDIFIFVTL